MTVRKVRQNAGSLLRAIEGVGGGRTRAAARAAHHRIAKSATGGGNRNCGDTRVSLEGRASSPTSRETLRVALDHLVSGSKHEKVISEMAFCSW